jgi:hypothetical protein
VQVEQLTRQKEQLVAALEGELASKNKTSSSNNSGGGGGGGLDGGGEESARPRRILRRVEVPQTLTVPQVHRTPHYTI